MSMSSTREASGGLRLTAAGLARVVGVVLPVFARLVGPLGRLLRHRIPRAVRRPGRPIGVRVRWAHAGRGAHSPAWAVLDIGLAPHGRRCLAVAPPVADGLAHAEAVDLDDVPDRRAPPTRVEIRAEIWRATTGMRGSSDKRKQERTASLRAHSRSGRSRRCRPSHACPSARSRRCTAVDTVP